MGDDAGEECGDADGAYGVEVGVLADEPGDVDDRAVQPGEQAGLRGCVEQHGEAVGGDEGREGPPRGQRQGLEAVAGLGGGDRPVEDARDGPNGRRRRDEQHDDVGSAGDARDEVLAYEVQYRCDKGKTWNEEEDGRDHARLMRRVDDGGALKGADDGHVEARRGEAADHPRHEVVDVAFEKQPANRLPDERRDEHGQAFDEPALVEEGEARAGQAGGDGGDGNRVEHRTPVNLLDVSDGVLDEERGGQRLNVCVETVDAVGVHPEVSLLDDLRAEGPVGPGRRRDGRVRHLDVEPFDAHRSGEALHAVLHPKSGRSGSQHVLSEPEDDVRLMRQTRVHGKRFGLVFLCHSSTLLRLRERFTS